jgi:serine/threonine protein kinase
MAYPRRRTFQGKVRLLQRINPDALPVGSMLHWYRIEAVLGQGGFGLTYLATDTNLEQPVAIKEYLPIDCATRLPDGSVLARGEHMEQRYRWGLQRFVSEAQVLARFDHPNIVRVHSVFEHNNTAYMVMRYEQGENLESILRGGRTLGEQDLLDLLLPILGGLEAIHAEGFIHRDIKPDNIYVRKDGTPVLLDFGSARQPAGESPMLTILVAPGYAPFEQYYETPTQQGPWTDIYSLGATLYRVVAGRAPPDAIARSRGVLGSTRDILVPAIEVGRGRYSERFLGAIDRALRFNEADRPQTIAEWRRLFEAPGPVPTPVQEPVDPEAPTRPAEVPGPIPAQIPTPSTQASPEPPRRRSTAALVWGLLALAGVAGVAGYLAGRGAATEVQQAAGDVAARMADARAERARIDAERAQLEQERGRLQGERSALDEGHDALERERSAVAEQRDALERERGEILQDRSALAAQRSAVEARAAAVDEGERSLAARRGALEPAEAAAAAEASRLEDLRVVLERREREQAQEARRLEAAGAAAEDEARALRARVASLERQLRERSAPPARAAAPAQEPASVAAPAALATARAALEAGDYARARGVLTGLADAGSAQAAYHLGVMELEGLGGPRRTDAGIAWLERAAAGGVADAHLRLGLTYADGGSVTRDEFLAYMWLWAASELGNEAARAARDQVGARLQPMEVEQAQRQARLRLVEPLRRGK